ncbi:MAG: Hsp70 family protein [Lachnospiraceae bacterium]|nr:Hsp70 family protein [Lachnospiraceae bacterium]
MVLGIDLGTTYSVAAYVDEKGDPHTIYNAEGKTTTPSVVYFQDESSVVVGQIAKDFKATEPKQVISTVKNAIGQDKEYNPLPNMKVSPQDVSSFVLRKVVRDAEMYFGNSEEIKDVVVTVPSYFTEAQRRATSEAVKFAGLNLISTINEPTAAAVYYAHKTKVQESKTLVFDLGGGTFDVTIMHINGADIEVLATNGHNNLGGSFFDQHLVDYVCEQFEEKHGIDLEAAEYNDLYYSLYEKVETAKRQICRTKSQTPIVINAGVAKDSIVLSYDYFLKAISKHCNKIIDMVNFVIEDAGLKPSDIDQVIMVGGSSRIPYMKEQIEKIMGKKPLDVVNPDEAVALGAAILADRLSKSEENVVKDVCSHGIGFLRYSPKDDKKYNVVMVQRNTQLPTKAGNDLFAFASDNQKMIKLVLTESEYEDVMYAVEIREVQITLPDGIKKGMAYSVELSIDEKQNIGVSVNIPELNQTVSEVSLDEFTDISDRKYIDKVTKRAKELLRINIA